MDVVRDWSREHLRVRLPGRSSRRSQCPCFAPPAPRGGVDPVLALLPYFQEHRTFLRGNTDRLMGPYELAWRECLPKLLGYAARYGFLHRNGRTVHEQILHRWSSERSDHLSRRRARTTSARARADLRRDVLAARGRCGVGVAPGDRVAIVGPNGTRYLTIDVAIGLAGAVAVPLYPTSPPAEIDEIVIGSGARLLFVALRSSSRGCPLPDDVRVVSFARDTDSVGTSEDVETWEAFLAAPAAAGTPPT